MKFVDDSIQIENEPWRNSTNSAFGVSVVFLFVAIEVEFDDEEEENSVVKSNEFLLKRKLLDQNLFSFILTELHRIDAMTSLIGFSFGPLRTKGRENEEWFSRQLSTDVVIPNLNIRNTQRVICLFDWIDWRRLKTKFDGFFITKFCFYQNFDIKSIWHKKNRTSRRRRYVPYVIIVYRIRRSLILMLCLVDKERKRNDRRKEKKTKRKKKKCKSLQTERLSE